MTNKAMVMNDIDELGELLDKQKRIGKLVDMLKAKILAGLPNGEHIGQTYVVSIIGKQMERLDSKRFKAECPNVFEQYVKTIDYRQISSRKV